MCNIASSFDRTAHAKEEPDQPDRAALTPNQCGIQRHPRVEGIFHLENDLVLLFDGSIHFGTDFYDAKMVHCNSIESFEVAFTTAVGHPFNETGALYLLLLIEIIWFGLHSNRIETNFIALCRQN